MTSANEEMINKVRLGDESEKFIYSPIGAEMLSRAGIRRQAALEKMASVDPDSKTEIRRLQNEVKNCDSFHGWLDELLNEAEQALYQNELENAED